MTTFYLYINPNMIDQFLTATVPHMPYAENGLSSEKLPFFRVALEKPQITMSFSYCLEIEVPDDDRKLINVNPRYSEYHADITPHMIQAVATPPATIDEVFALMEKYKTTSDEFKAEYEFHPVIRGVRYYIGQ